MPFVFSSMYIHIKLCSNCSGILFLCVDCSAEEDTEGEEQPGKDSPAYGRGEWKARVSLQEKIILDFALRF